VKPNDESLLYSKPDETKVTYYSTEEQILMAEEQKQQQEWENQKKENFNNQKRKHSRPYNKINKFNI